MIVNEFYGGFQGMPTDCKKRMLENLDMHLEDITRKEESPERIPPPSGATNPTPAAPQINLTATKKPEPENAQGSDDNTGGIVPPASEPCVDGEFKICTRERRGRNCREIFR
jgi:hypothetical protein